MRHAGLLALVVLWAAGAAGAAAQDHLGSVADGLAALGALDARAARITARVQEIRDDDNAILERSIDPDEEPPELLRELLALEAEAAELDARRARLLEALHDVALRDRAGLLKVLGSTKEPAHLEACAPAAGALGRADPAVARALLACARRVSPAPAPLRQAVADLGGPEAAGVLAELGAREKDGLSLRLALDAAFEAALPRVLDATASADPALAEAAVHALSTVEVRPPLDPDDLGGASERFDRLVTVFSTAKGDAGRAALVGLIARHAPADPAAADLHDLLGRTLLRLQAESPSDAVRAAIALAAGGTRGPAALEVVTAGLADPVQAVRRAAAAAVARGRHRGAAPALLDLLEEGDEPDRHAARAALKALAGRDLGDDIARWRRWWSSQPEAAASD
ncbi:MAG: HEAT repeat domain-containing protein [Planctomycetes bacterium]|nr:HEAT repeat domain-containing protein [Planctomycetota bacterium]